MKSRLLPYFLIALLPYCALYLPATEAPATWTGVDETVIEKYAEEAGRSGREPLINTDQGDLLLFVFLLAGALGGFVAGYAYRSLVHSAKRVQAVLLLFAFLFVQTGFAKEPHTNQHLPHQEVTTEEEALPLSFELTLSLYSLDIWNGMVGYNHPLFQPSARIAYEDETFGEFSLETVFLYPLGAPRPAKVGGLSESDYIIAWSKTFDNVNVELGCTYYSLPPDHTDDLYEGYLGVRYENDWVVPYVTGYYDFNQTEGTYLKAGLCKTVKLADRLKADIDLSCGYGFAKYNLGYFDTDISTFTDATAQLILQYDITDNFFIGGTAAFSMLLDNSIRDSRFVNDEYDTVDNFWFGLHTGIHF